MLGYMISGSIVSYSGKGPNVVGSYSFQFNPPENVSSISITGIENLATPVMNEGQIEIQYGGVINTALTSNTVLTPGSGNVSSARPSAAVILGQPIVWGCGVRSTAAYKYIPSNCRYML